MAVGEGGSERVVVLVEAKSHPKEVYGGGTQAGEVSRERIEQAIRSLQRELELEERPERWLDALRPDEPGHSSVYQSANRYAHLFWLRQEGVLAWLVHVLFVEDPTHGSTTRAQWEEALPKIEADLGLQDVTIPHAGHVFLPGLDPEIER